MYTIGIDVGSTFTKYCVMQDGTIITLFSEKTPVRQREYFEKKTCELIKQYPDAKIVSCGYGKSNASALDNINELTALAKGFYFVTGKDGYLLDIGGQDLKIIYQEKGRLRQFFLNDKCAAGSGLFLMNTLELLGLQFGSIDLSMKPSKPVMISNTCAVFAQSDIVELIADNRTEYDIVYAVICQIINKAKPLIMKTDAQSLYISGGMSSISGITGLLFELLEVECNISKNSTFLASIGCAMSVLHEGRDR